MGVMLQRDAQKQRLYLHNVVAIKKEEAITLSQDDSLTNWSDESDSRLFITSILQKAINVKADKQKTEKKSAETITYDDEGNIIPLSKKFDAGNHDIHYSVSSESDKPKSSEMSRGQKAKFVANNTKMKKYSRKDAEANIDKILEEIVYGDESQEWQAKLSGKNREEAISMLFEELNRADPDRRGGVALRMADYILNNATMQETYNAEIDSDNAKAGNKISGESQGVNRNFFLRALRTKNLTIF